MIKSISSLLRLALFGCLLSLLVHTPLLAAVPGVLNYQGRVTVSDENFHGTGHFKFALVSAEAVYWTNDPNGTAAPVPATALALPVHHGLFSIDLGAAAPYGMAPLPSAAFANPDLYLKVWFSPDGQTFSELTPATRLTSVAYAQNSAQTDAVAFEGVKNKPTTLQGYGITDAQPLNEQLTTLAASGSTAYGRSLLSAQDGVAARTHLGAAARGVNTDITGLEGLTQPLPGSPELADVYDSFETLVGAAAFDHVTNVFTLNQHGLSDGEPFNIRAYTSGPVNLGLDNIGLSKAVAYYVTEATANSFKLAPTAGGAPVDLHVTGGTATLYRLNSELHGRVASVGGKVWNGGVNAGARGVVRDGSIVTQGQNTNNGWAAYFDITVDRPIFNMGAVVRWKNATGRWGHTVGLLIISDGSFPTDPAHPFPHIGFDRYGFYVGYGTVGFPTAGGWTTYLQKRFPTPLPLDIDHVFHIQLDGNTLVFVTPYGAYPIFDYPNNQGRTAIFEHYSAAGTNDANDSIEFKETWVNASSNMLAGYTVQPRSSSLDQLATGSWTGRFHVQGSMLISGQTPEVMLDAGYQRWNAKMVGTSFRVESGAGRGFSMNTDAGGSVMWGLTQLGVWYDPLQSIYAGTIFSGQNQVVGAREGGWTVPTGPALRSGYTTYTAPTIAAQPTQAEVQALANQVEALSKTLKALVEDLHSASGHGLIGP